MHPSPLVYPIAHLVPPNSRHLKGSRSYAVLHEFFKVVLVMVQDRIPWGLAPLAAENAPFRRGFGLSPPGGKSAFPQTPSQAVPLGVALL